MNRRRIRGAVALEYILIAGLAAIALVGALRYFVNTMKMSMQTLTEDQGKEVGRAYYFLDRPLRDGPAADSDLPGLVKK